jgi:hypothetical protein
LTNELRPTDPVLPPRATTADVWRWFGGEDDRRQACPLPAVAEFIRTRCSERYFVTLTDRRKLSAEEFSRSVGWALHKTNEAFFGTHYKRRRAVFLATYAVQERTFRDGLHTHLVVGVPDGSLGLKPNRPAGAVGEYLVDVWTGAERSYRRREGQDWRPIADLDRLFGYVQKTIWSPAAFDHVDVGNTTFPTTYAVPDRG